jgi:hypothetical protein
MAGAGPAVQIQHPFVNKFQKNIFILMMVLVGFISFQINVTHYNINIQMYKCVILSVT